ncbi:MAG: ABC transporter permease, partial [Ruminococcus sp.]
MKVKHRFPPKWFVTLVWILGFLLLWEIGAFLVENNPKIRNPEYILPHMWQIFASFFDTNLTTATQTPFQVVLTACGDTLSRAGIGFIIGLSAGFILALLMNLSNIVEKVAFPYLMLIQV